MLNLKTQLEIRYTTILNFKTEYKNIISPYLKLCEFNINNVNSIDEYVVLTFKNGKYYFDCRWDKIIFVAEGIRDDLKKAQGPLFMFFEILDKLKKLPSFGQVQNVLLAEWNLAEYDLAIEESKAKFKSTFLSKKIPEFSHGFPNEDFAITTTYGDQNDKYYRFIFGPFVPNKDAVTHNLVPLSKTIPSDWKDKNGIFSQSFLFEKTIQADLDFYKKATRSIGSFLDKIKLNE